MPNFKEKLYEIGQYIPGILFVIFIGIFGFRSCTTTTNERGFLGMDKDGRQIFIQTMNYYSHTIDDKFTYTSDWDDFSFLERLWQEPMRTTLRIYETMDKDEYFKFQTAKGLADLIFPRDIESILDIPYQDSGLFQDANLEINMDENYTISLGELEKRVKETDVITHRDLLRGFGFTKFEYFVNGKLECSIILNPKITNTIEKGSWSTIGSLKNE